MKTSVQLAIAVLVEESLLVKDGNGYAWKVPAEIQGTDAREVSGVIVSSAPPAWLMSLGQDKDGGNYIPKRPVDRVMCAYKISRGIAWYDRAWDKAQYAVCLRAAQKLLDAFNGEDEKAGYWLQTFAAEMKESGLPWTLAAAARRAWDTKGEREI